jgi:hypothetical protein
VPITWRSTWCAADNHLALFPDADLGCRTGRAARPRKDHGQLAGLDAGYGYSADGGKTFPLRGKGLGLIPSLDEILAANPMGRFSIAFRATTWPPCRSWPRRCNAMATMPGRWARASSAMPPWSRR